MPHAFVFDVNKCTGCGACQLACSIENQLEPDVSWRHVTTFNEPRHPGIPLFHLSLACNHCAQPACMDACPALAYERDDVTGAVLINEDSCIGCGYCAWACPFDAPKLDHDRGVMTKCTFCNHRLSQGQTPACASLCPTGALTVAEVPARELHQPVAGFPQTELKPAIRIIPPRGDFVPMAGTAAPLTLPDDGSSLESSMPTSKITLRKEWPLAIFTLVAAVLFGIVAAGTMGATHGAAVPLPATLPWPVSVAAVLFALLAGAGMLLGSAHLGRKERAWRIILNVRRSPLSREIVAFSAFVAAGLGYLVLAPGNEWIGLLASATGALALFAVEDVYRFAVRAVPGVPHSASVVLTGPLLAAAMTMAYGPRDRLLAGVALGLGAIKLILYLQRHARLRAQGRDRAVVTRLRLPLLLVGLLILGAGLPGWIGLAAILLGELIDRCELYTELHITTPRRQMVTDLDRML